MRIAILGAGESGVGAALLAQAKGLDVFVSDMGQIKEQYKAKLATAAIHFEEGTHTFERILAADQIIKSPGIPDKAEIIKQATAKNIPIISEIEFAGRYTDAKFICITGTNGKTTTTLLTYHLLKNAGLNVGLAGNIGESLAEKVIENKHEYYVVELSSFQLDNMYQFKAHIGVLTNITPDHLDRYEYSMDKYAASKLRIIQNMAGSDFFVFNADDENIAKAFNSEKFGGTTIPLTLKGAEGAKVYFEGSSIKVEAQFYEGTVDTSKSGLIGKHNQYNTMAAVAVAKLVGVADDAIEKALETFENAEHRLQQVGVAKEVTYINDSKATNVEAVWYALEGIKQPIVWIAGGVDKGNDYSTLVDLAREKVKVLVCLGKDNEKLKQAFGRVVPIIAETTSIEYAVRLSRSLATPGDVVLLSPACASFDLFNNYEHRGQRFKEAVQKIVLKK
ncbi:UDP-N-acetylmuramoyl-L-alanine--D-glutamate ligase [Pontibacter cellulosilyticus]|uniref:UDP-N-acetylmuramoylalanine--D-glutamate ligase n=1 Tax=Pontibacter cellulosilyticus TaxID=1720253 RepID=A0A923SPX7_9BACT|nr:UDP-N-acetylmuramoyl-L-alanine--D-glutamate ligase [Pontibacter cellulosilyticus]MBC5994585.1 UDP-N-acetylmuramoyl-L-alanine--D-glutamate ligase [Pontibacter cellulosilyticus]